MRGSRLAFILFVVSTGSLFVRAAEPQLPIGSEIIDLPKFEVREDRILPPLEKWHYISIPGYEILSNASKGNTERFVKDFYLLQQVAQILLPQAETATPLPTYVVLCAKGNAFTHFMPEDVRRQSSRISSLFFNDSERTAIVVNFSPSWSEDSSFLSSLSLSSDNADQTADPFRVFYREYFRRIVRRSIGSNAPRWLEEGLIQLFSTVDFSTRHIEFAKVAMPGFGFSRGGDVSGFGASNFGGGRGSFDGMPTFSETGRAGPYNGSVGRALIPLDKFFAVDRNTPPSEDLGDYANQAYLFTHMCLYGVGQRYQQAYYKLALRAQQGPITEEIFRECFNKSYRAIGIEMRGYTTFTDYRQQNFNAKKGSRLAEAPPFTLRQATDAESGRIAGEVLRLAGHEAGALNRLIAPYIRGDRTPDLLAALGLAELSANNTARARKFLEAAAVAKTTRPRAYLELSKLRLNEAKAKAASENRPLTDKETAFVLEPLQVGLTYPPAMAELYDNLARIWIESPTTISPQQYQVLLTGAYRNPRNISLVYNVAAAGVTHGYVKECRPLVAYGLKVSPTPKAREAFTQLASALPPENPNAAPTLVR